MDHPTTVDTNLSKREEPNAYSLQIIFLYYITLNYIINILFCSGISRLWTTVYLKQSGAGISWSMLKKLSNAQIKKNTMNETRKVLAVLSHFATSFNQLLAVYSLLVESWRVKKDTTYLCGSGIAL